MPLSFSSSLPQVTNHQCSEKSLLNGKQRQYMADEDEFEFPKLIPIRASTAPPRPLTEIEEYR